MIDKELRFMGFIMRLFFIPSLLTFKFVHALSRMQRGKPLKGVQSQEFWIPRKNENSKIRIRTYQPPQNKSLENQKEKLPAVLYLHGGRHVLSVPKIAHRNVKQVLKTRDCVRIAPDYRKSVNHPYPAALHDAYDTLLWIKENAEQLGIRTDQIIVAGHSAGGGLCAATCLYARDQKEVKVAFQMPIYPMIDERMTNPSAVNNTAPLWNAKSNKIAWGQYLKGIKEKGLKRQKNAAPSRETDYSNLPPAATFVGDIEPFKNETIEFVENLKKAGIAVQFEVFKGCYHGFEAVAPKAKVSQAANQFLSDAFAFGVDNYFAEQE